MESWSLEGNGVGIAIPSTAAFPPGISVHVAEVLLMETTVQRHLQGSFCRDVGDGLTLHLLIPLPACSPRVDQG